MRILHILNDLTNRGNGIVNVAVDLAIEQAKSGHEVWMVAAKGEYGQLVQTFGISHCVLDQTRRPLTLVFATVRLGAILRKVKPDVIHAHMRTGLLLAWLLSRVPRIPLVAHLHNVHDSESAIMRIADRVIAVSNSVMQTMSSGQIPREKFRIVLNGPIGNVRTPPVTNLKAVPLQHPAIVTVAGMNDRKGISELIHAFTLLAEEFPQGQLYLVGDGPERQIFEAQAGASHFSNRIHFVGWQANPQAWMLSCDIFVLASRRESIGLALLEARQVGCAIVASDVDGIPEALAGGKAGMLVPPRQPEALADALRYLLNSKACRESLGRHAQEGLEVFTVTHMAAKVEDIYDELIVSLKKLRPSEITAYAKTSE